MKDLFIYFGIHICREIFFFFADTAKFWSSFLNSFKIGTKAFSHLVEAIYNSLLQQKMHIIFYSIKDMLNWFESYFVFSLKR